MLQSVPISDKDRQLAEKLQKWRITQKFKKLYQKMKKNYRYRKNVIYELINTERGYCNDLQIICESVQAQLYNILTKEELETLFMNIDQIAKFNNVYLETMEIGFKNYDIFTPYQIVFGEAKGLVENEKQSNQGFTCYFPYCSNFTKSNKMLMSLQQSNNNFKEFLTQLSRSNKLRGMDLSSFLVKPIQRLPKYILLFKDLLKHTPDDHPDYKNIKYLLEYFGDVNQINNQQMDDDMKRLIVQELLQNLGKTYEELNINKNELMIFEDKLTLIQQLNGKEEQDMRVNVHALTQHLILVQDGKYYKTVEISSLSFVKDQQDTKYFTNLFQIVGVDDTIQCIAESGSSKKKSIQQYEHLIETWRQQECKQNNNQIARYPVQVRVIGTEERNYQSFTKHTVYITEIKIGKVQQNIFIRYSEIQEMYERYSKIYKKGAFPQFPSNSWLTGHKTKTIEERQIAIENFLQISLSSPEILAGGQILSDLRLPSNFLDLPMSYINQQFKDLENKKIMQTTSDALDDLARKGIQIDLLKKSSGELLNGVEIEKQSQRMKVYQLSRNAIMIWEKELENSATIFKIGITMPDDEVCYIGVDAKTTVGETLSFTAQCNKLHYYRDFRLYLVDQLNKQRVLDDDEVLYKVYIDEKNNNRGLMNKLEKLLTQSEENVVIRLKKYITLIHEMEAFDYEHNTKRLRYLAFSVLQSVHEQKFNLNFKDYCLFAALYYHIKYQEKIQLSLNTLQLDKIRNVIPQDFYKTLPEKEWEQMTMQLIVHLNDKLNGISQHNKNEILQRKLDPRNVLIELSDLACRVVMNAVKDNPLHQMSVFQVQTYEKTLKYFKSLGIEIYPTIYIGVTINKLHLLNPHRKETFKTYDYKLIKSIRSFPSQVVFEMETLKEPIRFDTYMSYEIKLLIEQYDSIIRFMEDYLKMGI